MPPGVRCGAARPRVRSPWVVAGCVSGGFAPGRWTGRSSPLPSFAWAAARDPLDEQTWRAMVAGVSTRAYAGALDPVPVALQERSTSRSAVSRRFVALSHRQLTTCLSRPLAELDLWVVMIDGIAYRDHTILVALGVDASGTKHVLGVREGTTENTTVGRRAAQRPG